MAAHMSMGAKRFVAFAVTLAVVSLCLISSEARPDGSRIVSGCRWEFITGEPASLFNTVQFLDARLAFAASSNCLWRTEDGGRQWKELYCLPEVAESRDRILRYQFFDREEGWLLAENYLLHTCDAGKSWEKKAFDSTIIVRSFSFLDRRTGWFVADRLLEGVPDFRGAVYATEDGGGTWKEIPTGISVDYRWRLSSVLPRSRTDVWVVGDFILHSVDGGKTWRQPPANENFLYALRNTSIRFLDLRIGWIHRLPPDNYLFTRDGGRTWSPRPRPHVLPVLWDLLFVSPTEAWATGGHLARSVDGGKTWRVVFKALEEKGDTDIERSYNSLQYLKAERKLIVTTDQGLAVCTFR